MSQLEVSIQNARRDKRWVEASTDLERWLSMSKSIYQAETAELPISVAPSGGVMGKFFGGGKTVRSTSFTNEEEELRKLVPKVRRCPRPRCCVGRPPPSKCGRRDARVRVRWCAGAEIDR